MNFTILENMLLYILNKNHLNSLHISESAPHERTKAQRPDDLIRCILPVPYRTRIDLVYNATLSVKIPIR
jgi:hypothetical protein